VSAIASLFEDDGQVTQVISALYEGSTPEETCATCAMSRTDYNSARKRIRRAIIRAGLRFPEL
jgi:flagellin-specific chaperone FliS